MYKLRTRLTPPSSTSSPPVAWNFRRGYLGVYCRGVGGRQGRLSRFLTTDLERTRSSGLDTTPGVGTSQYTDCFTSIIMKKTFPPLGDGVHNSLITVQTSVEGSDRNRQDTKSGFCTSTTLNIRFFVSYSILRF